MDSDWPLVRLGDYCLKIGSGATPTGGSSVYLEQGEICLIRSQNIYNDGFKSDGLVFITADAANKLKSVTVQRNDILLNITGDSVARVCLAREEFLPARVNQHVAIIRPNPDEFDPRYLRYLLASPLMQSYLLTIAAVGATRNALTKVMIETLEVSKPPMQIQTAIADQLQSLDKKIHLNNQTNQTLEKIAQAIFKSWFVDFDPVKAKMTVLEAGGTAEQAELAAMSVISAKSEAALKQLQAEQPEAYAELAQTAALFPSKMVDSELGETPEGWEVGRIGDIASVKGGYAFKSKEFESIGSKVVKIKNIVGDGRVDLTDCDCVKEPQPEKLDKFKVFNGDLLMAMTGATVGKIGIAVTGSSCVYLNQRVAKFESKIKTKKVSWYLFPCIQQKSVFDTIVGSAQGSAQPNISSNDIERTEIVVPDENLISEYCELFDPIFKKWIANNIQNSELANLRDTLLPKLLSGELIGE